jgi:hypothetical protein
MFGKKINIPLCYSDFITIVNNNLHKRNSRKDFTLFPSSNRLHLAYSQLLQFHVHPKRRFSQPIFAMPTIGFSIKESWRFKQGANSILKYFKKRRKNKTHFLKSN